MFLMSVRCLCLSFTLIACARSQRLNSWVSSSQVGYNNDRFSNWNSKNTFNEFSPSQNSHLESWGTNVANDQQPAATNWGTNLFSSNGNDKKVSDYNKNKKSDLWSFNSQNRPDENSGKNSKWENQNSYDNNINSASSGWDLNKPSESEPSKKLNTGYSGNWQSDAFKTNIWPNEKKSASIINYATSSNSKPNSDSNKNFPSSNSGNSYWDSSNSNSNQFSNSNNNQNVGSWNSNIDDNNSNSNDVFSSSDYEDNNGNSVSSSWNLDNNVNLKPSSNTNGYWGSNTQNSKNKKIDQQNKKKTSSGRKPSSNNSNGWDTNNSYNSKPGKSEKETNIEKPSKNQSEKKPSNLDTSILDELDKNDWYFGKESDYPSSPPFRSALNIDVSELWNFDKNRESNSNVGGAGNKRRKNRQIGQFESNIQCECVNVNLCDEDDMIITQKDLGNDWRSIKEFRCDDLTEVCCKMPKTRRPLLRTNIIEENQDEPLRCGQKRINGYFSDNLVQPGELPWTLRLEKYGSSVNCSASLINPKMALTAAHCVDNMQSSNLEVKAGLWSANDEPSQNRGVMKIILHPDYSSENPRNDIALLVLERPFKLTDNVNTICLPVTNDKWDPNQCFVAGWRPKEINGDVLEVLEKGIVKFLPQLECQNIMLVTDLWRDYVLHDSFVCGVEKTSQDYCLGNEGSSVMCPSEKSPDTYIQIGIVSNSMKCDEWGRPGIFTNVLKFLDWISENIFDLGLIDDIDVRSLL